MTSVISEACCRVGLLRLLNPLKIALLESSWERANFLRRARFDWAASPPACVHEAAVMLQRAAENPQSLDGICNRPLPRQWSDWRRSKSAAVPCSQAERQAIVEISTSLSQAVAGTLASSAGLALWCFPCDVGHSRRHIRARDQHLLGVAAAEAARLKKSPNSSNWRKRRVGQGDSGGSGCGCRLLCWTVALGKPSTERLRSERRSGSSFRWPNRQPIHRPRHWIGQNIPGDRSFSRDEWDRCIE